jgi:hypothetical protein
MIKEKNEVKYMARLKPLNDFIFQKLMGEQGSEAELKTYSITSMTSSS